MSAPILYGSPRAQKGLIPKTIGSNGRTTTLGYTQRSSVQRYVIPPPPTPFPQTVHQGTIASYGFGGFRGGYAPNYPYTVDKMPFASLGTAVVVSSLPETFSKEQSKGAVDRVGNAGIGFPSLGLIHKVPFANDTAVTVGVGVSSSASLSDATFSDTNNSYGIYGTTAAGTAFKRYAYVSETTSQVSVSNAPPKFIDPSTPSTKREGGITDNIQNYGYATFADGNMQGFAFTSGTPYTLGPATIVYSPAAPTQIRSRNILQGHSSSERGYRWTRGDGTPSSVSFPFNSGVIVAEDLGNAIGGTQERYGYSATNSQEHGYLSSGSYTTSIGSDVITRFPFASPSNVFTDVGQLSSSISAGLGGWAS